MAGGTRRTSSPWSEGVEGSGFASPSGPATDLTVAIVAPSASQDLAFTQTMIDSLTRSASSPRSPTAPSTSKSPPTRSVATPTDGIDVVIAHGTQYGGSLAEIAPDFPETSFIWGTSTSTQDLPNVFAYTPEPSRVAM